MTATPLHCQSAASEAATKDREQAAYAVVSVAITEAAALYAEGRKDDAAARMDRAEASARRILGGAA